MNTLIYNDIYFAVFFGVLFMIWGSSMVKSARVTTRFEDEKEPSTFFLKFVLWLLALATFGGIIYRYFSPSRWILIINVILIFTTAGYFTTFWWTRQSLKEKGNAYRNSVFLFGSIGLLATLITAYFQISTAREVVNRYFSNGNKKKVLITDLVRLDSCTYNEVELESALKIGLLSENDKEVVILRKYKLDTFQNAKRVFDETRAHYVVTGYYRQLCRTNIFSLKLNVFNRNDSTQQKIVGEYSLQNITAQAGSLLGLSSDRKLTAKTEGESVIFATGSRKDSLVSPDARCRGPVYWNLRLRVNIDSLLQQVRYSTHVTIGKTSMDCEFDPHYEWAPRSETFELIDYELTGYDTLYQSLRLHFYNADYAPSNEGFGPFITFEGKVAADKIIGSLYWHKEPDEYRRSGFRVDVSTSLNSIAGYSPL